MNSNNHPAAYGYQPLYGQRYPTPAAQYQPKPPVQEDTLSAGRVEIERKSFTLALKENPRGRFLRITETCGTKRATIIIPATGLKEFQKVLADLIAADAATPPANPVNPATSPT